MNPATEPTAPATTPAKGRKTRKVKPVTTARRIDPEIVSLRQEHAHRVQLHRVKKASARLVEKMIRRLPELTSDDRLILAEHLPEATPPLHGILNQERNTE